FKEWEHGFDNQGVHWRGGGMVEVDHRRFIRRRDASHASTRETCAFTAGRVQRPSARVHHSLRLFGFAFRPDGRELRVGLVYHEFARFVDEPNVGKEHLFYILELNTWIDPLELRECILTAPDAGHRSAARSLNAPEAILTQLYSEKGIFQAGIGF